MAGEPAPRGSTARREDIRGGGERTGRPRSWGRTGAIRRRLLAPLPRERKPARSRNDQESHKSFDYRAVSAIDAARPEPKLTAMRIALFEPDIPQNTGTILRLAACLGVEAHIVEPAGFPSSDRAFRRAGMDYLDQVTLRRHACWAAFEAWRRAEGAAAGAVHHRRQHVLSRPQPTGADDILMFGRESAGVPEEVHAAADARLLIPMRPGLRSLNVAMAGAMAVGEALRQTKRT